MVDINHRIGIRGKVSDIYGALATVEGIARWWTEDTTGNPEPGGSIKFLFRTSDGKEIGGMECEVIELVTDKKVHWRFTSGPEEWIGTDVEFTLSQAEDFTIVLFSHKNWQSLTEFTGHCSTKWAVFLLSLKEYVETGKGKPSPDDIKIDNWN